MTDGGRIGVTAVPGYTVEALIGRGGTGDVYRAMDERLGRPVALKVVSERVASDERYRARLLEESRRAASLDHLNVVPVYDGGGADGRLFLAMRYVNRDRPQGAAAPRGRVGARDRDRSAGGPCARCRAPPRSRPSRRQAEQRPARPSARARPRVPRRLRPDAEHVRPRAGRWSVPRHGRLRRARADPRRRGGRTGRSQRARVASDAAMARTRLRTCVRMTRWPP